MTTTNTSTKLTTPATASVDAATTDTLQALSEIISARRSIRKFTDLPVSKEVLELLLDAARLAPSAKNRQPWKFIVLQGQAKADMLKAFKNGLARERDLGDFLPNYGHYIGGAEHSVTILEKAPAVILVVNTNSRPVTTTVDVEERIAQNCDIQAIGAAIQNMLLTGTAMGLGTLWVCDYYFAYPELMEWINEPGDLLAMVAVGWPGEEPGARPRRDLKDITEWR